MVERGFRVLVVDDEPEIRRFLRASLKSHQHEVIEAENGTKALAAVRGDHPDLMILDLGLPDMDGVEVTRRVRQWNQLPIIILSVRSRESDKIEALNAGADDYLTKPFGIGELLARVRVVMRRVGNTGTIPVYRVKNLVVDNDHHQVSVKDCGIGIPSADLEHIFYKFYRVQRQEAIAGTGLGLSLCKGIVEAHGGHIWVVNNPDKGVTVIFTLPLS